MCPVSELILAHTRSLEGSHYPVGQAPAPRISHAQNVKYAKLTCQRLLTKNGDNLNVAMRHATGHKVGPVLPVSDAWKTEVRLEMHRQGVKQKDLAEYCGCSKAAISQLLGDSSPALSALVPTISKRLGIKTATVTLETAMERRFIDLFREMPEEKQALMLKVMEEFATKP